MFTEEQTYYYMWEGQEDDLLRDDEAEVAIVEKRPSYPPMELVFPRGIRHFELWLATNGDKDGIWIGDPPERLRTRGKEILAEVMSAI